MSHLVFKEKKSYPYIYISNTGDFFMSVAMMGIISNEHITIGADNTCQTAVEFQKAFRTALGMSFISGNPRQPGFRSTFFRVTMSGLNTSLDTAIRPILR